jgi:hypothetical protein
MHTGIKTLNPIHRRGIGRASGKTLDNRVAKILAIDVIQDQGYYRSIIEFGEGLDSL